MQSNEERKLDFSNLPRGAIGIKGLPVSRNARLPSIRSPRDLTLGSQPKRTFLPNIPVRREKKSTDAGADASQQKTKNTQNSLAPERGRGRGRGRGIIIQTEGSVFGEGFSMDAVSRKDKHRESYQSYTKSGTSSSGRAMVKKEQFEANISRVDESFGNLLRDDFIDDGDDDVDNLKPIIFPPETHLKKEVKKEKIEETTSFNPAIAEDMGFDIEKVTQFIKKEKGTEEEEKHVSTPVTEAVENDVNKLFSNSVSQLLLLQLPQCVTVEDKSRDSNIDSAHSSKQQTNGETISDELNKNRFSLASLPDGFVGKLQLLKSGTARLMLGNLKFHLDSVTPASCHQEIACIRTNSNTGDLVVLGNTEQKLKFVPDVDTFLR